MLELHLLMVLSKSTIYNVQIVLFDADKVQNAYFSCVIASIKNINQNILENIELLQTLLQIRQQNSNAGSVKPTL